MSTRNSSSVQSSRGSRVPRDAAPPSVGTEVLWNELDELDLGPKKVNYKRNDVSLAPALGRAAETVPLRFFSAPTYNNDRERILAMSGHAHSGNQSGGRRAGSRTRAQSGANGLLKSRTRRSDVKDALTFCQHLVTATLTDSQAEDVVYPYTIPQYTIESLVSAICDRMIETTPKLAWYRPQPRPDWCDDLRFIGDWWICLCDRTSDRFSAVQHSLKVDPDQEHTVYPPLLDTHARTDDAEEQLIADLALRMQGRLYHWEVLHIDHITLTPDRLQVLLFGGVAKRRAAHDGTNQYGNLEQWGTNASPLGPKHVSFAPAEGAAPRGVVSVSADVVEDALHVLSLSICGITTAGALIILSALTYLAQRKPFISTLDVSFNELTHLSLSCFTRILPLTRVVRLSLRGNVLKCAEPSTLRDFLREGAGLVQELDLGHTQLTYSQVCTIIECLPDMYSLRTLLLDYVEVPAEKSTALAKAIIASRLWQVSLNGVAACTGSAYMTPIMEACERHRREALDGADMMTSFFERFFQRSYAKGWRPPVIRALPEGYRVFTSNDPSLHRAATQEPVWLRDS